MASVEWAWTITAVYTVNMLDGFHYPVCALQGIGQWQLVELGPLDEIHHKVSSRPQLAGRPCEELGNGWHSDHCWIERPRRECQCMSFGRSDTDSKLDHKVVCQPNHQIDMIGITDNVGSALTAFFTPPNNDLLSFRASVIDVHDFYG